MEQEPEAQIELWFNEERLERFAASFEEAPDLWCASHLDCDDQSPQAIAYIHLLDSLGESTNGDAHARLSCAVALCRVFCRLLLKKLRWAAGESLAGGTGLEVALALCPSWVRRAERYLHCLPLVYKEEELRTPTLVSAPPRRSDEEKPAEEEETGIKDPPTALHTDTTNKEKADKEEETGIKDPPTALHTDTTNKEKADKSSRPVPALVPISSSAPVKPSSKSSLLRRVVCGMRRAAAQHGLTRQAAGVVAKEIGNVEERVYALWCALRKLVEVKFSALVSRGDAPAQANAAQLTYLDWAVADLLMLHEGSPVDESSYQQYKQKLALLATFHLVQRFGLERPAWDPPPQRWHEAARWYSKTGVRMSPVGLQRRWHEMKREARRRLRPLLQAGGGGGGAAAPEPLHRAIATRYPHVVTGPLRPWRQLVAAGLAAKPTNERGTKCRNKPPDTNKEGTENRDLTVLKDMETIGSLGGESQASGSRTSAPSVRPGPSERRTTDAYAKPKKVGENRNNENTRDVKKAIDKGKIDVDAASSESDQKEKNQRIDDRNMFDKGRKVVGKTVSKSNVPNRSDYGTHVIQQIEKELFSDREIIKKIEKELFSGRDICRLSKNISTTTQKCTNVLNTEAQSKTKKSNGDEVIAKDTISSAKMNNNESNSNIMNDPHKHPLLTQMLQTVCIFDDNDEFTKYIEKNEQISKSKPVVSKNTNFNEIENKSLISVENKHRRRKRASGEVSSNWTTEIVRAVKKQRLEIEALENSQIYNLFNEELSGDNVNKRNVQTEFEDSESVIDLDSDDEVYDGNSDDQEDAGEVEWTESDFDPKLLMYPIVLMTRMENDPSLRILRPPSSQSHSPSPSPSLEPISSHDTIPSPKYLFHEKTRALLKLCKPCVVLLSRSELEDRGGGRLLKKVELQDIEDVRRNNRSMLTAQVAPLAKHQNSKSSSDTESCDSELEPEVVKKPARVKGQKNTDDDLRRLLNDFVGAPDAECCEHSKNIKMRGELASLQVERGCARCMWRVLCSPPANAGEAQLQRRLLRHGVPQAESVTPAPKIAEVPREVPKRRPSKKRSLPTSTTEPDHNTAPEKQKQSVPSVTAPGPVKTQPDAPRTNAGFKVVLEPRKPTLHSEALSEKKLVRRVNAPIFRPGVVADINKRLGMLMEDPPPPATGGFLPVITNVLSLAPETNQQKKTPTTETDKQFTSKSARVTPDLSVIERQGKPASSYDSRRLPDYAVASSHSGSQPRFYLQNRNCQRTHLETNLPVDMSNSLHPDADYLHMHNMTHSTGVTRLPPIQTVDGQTGSHYFVPQEMCLGNMLVRSNTLAGNVIPTQDFRNATRSNQGNYVCNQQTSAFQPILHINANQANQYLMPTMSRHNPFATAPGFSPTYPFLDNPMIQNTFAPMNAGRSQTFFNSMQASESQACWTSSPPYDAPYYTQAGTLQVNASRAVASAVEVEIDGETTQHPEQYDPAADEDNSLARLEWDVPPVPAHEWAVGHDPATLCVLCAGAFEHPWTLLGQFLVLSDLEPPPPCAEVWALSPRVRLQLPHESDNPNKTFKTKHEPDDPTADPEKPTRIKVKSFARMIEDSRDTDEGQDRKRELAPARLCHDDVTYQKLSEYPLVYAKLLVAVRDASACCALLARGAALQLYCLHSCRLYPLLAQPLGPGARLRLSGDAEVIPAVRALASQLRTSHRGPAPFHVVHRPEGRP